MYTIIRVLAPKYGRTLLSCTVSTNSKQIFNINVHELSQALVDVHTRTAFPLSHTDWHIRMLTRQHLDGAIVRGTKIHAHSSWCGQTLCMQWEALVSADHDFVELCMQGYAPQGFQSIPKVPPKLYGRSVGNSTSDGVLTTFATWLHQARGQEST
jgi:hypothetical protein